MKIGYSSKRKKSINLDQQNYFKGSKYLVQGHMTIKRWSCNCNQVATASDIYAFSLCTVNTFCKNGSRKVYKSTSWSSKAEHYQEHNSSQGQLLYQHDIDSQVECRQDSQSTESSFCGVHVFGCCHLSSFLDFSSLVPEDWQALTALSCPEGGHYSSVLPVSQHAQGPSVWHSCCCYFKKHLRYFS